MCDLVLNGIFCFSGSCLGVLRRVGAQDSARRGLRGLRGLALAVSCFRHEVFREKSSRTQRPEERVEVPKSLLPLFFSCHLDASAVSVHVGYATKLSMKWSEWPGYRAGARWTRSSRPDDDGTVYTRPLGLLESGFDVGGQRQGQSDVHALLKVDLRWLDVADAVAGEATTSRERSNRFLERVLDAWTTIRARHPLLASFVRDAPTEALPGVPPREFVFPEPRSRGEALSDARRTVLLHDAEEQASLDAACLEVLDRYVLNGERVLLEQDACLARLVLVRRPEEPLALGLILVVAHVVRSAPFSGVSSLSRD